MPRLCVTLRGAFLGFTDYRCLYGDLLRLWGLREAKNILFCVVGER